MISEFVCRGETAQRIADAVADLCAKEQYATRETVAKLTGLALTVVDDRLRTLVNDGVLARVQRGVFVPAVQHPPTRAMSRTLLPDGTTKLEVGDDVLTLTPREARMLGDLMSGAAAQLMAIETGHQVALLTSTISKRVRKIERRMQGGES
jgi:hypothetical protein